MKSYFNSKKNREKHRPDKVLKKIKNSYENNSHKLILSLTKESSPLLNYNYNSQLSFLEMKKEDNKKLIEELIISLQYTVFFMEVSKKERIKISKNMRLYFRYFIENQLSRINFFLEDFEFGNLKKTNNVNQSLSIIDPVILTLNYLRKYFELELRRIKSLPRVTYLTGFQVSMGPFLLKLKELGVKQKDQITIIKNLFDDFKVDWEVLDRENIKLSILKPAQNYLRINQKYENNIMEPKLTRFYSDDLISNFIEQAKVLKDEFKRF